MDIAISDVSIAHRLGTFQPDRPRPIILKFVARTHKMQALMNRRKLKCTGEGISKDLTKENYIFWQKVKTHDNIEAAWTWDGIVLHK